MDDEQLWCIYFAGILALRMHPRNIETGDDKHLIKLEVEIAAQIADLALAHHHDRFPVEKGD